MANSFSFCTFAAMRIAVNTRLLLPGQMDGQGYFTQEIFFRLAKKYPNHEFIFFFDSPVDSSIAFPKNVRDIVLPNKSKSQIMLRWWFDVKIPLALKKYKADVFVSPDGHCSLLTGVPQVLVVSDLSFLHYPSFFTKTQLLFYKRYTPLYLKKAKVITAVSGFCKDEIVARYKVVPQKVINVQSAARTVFQPVGWKEKEAIKETFAEGCEYLVFMGGSHPCKNLVNLLKAFSIFKKWQKTNMKLLVVGKLHERYNKVIEKLQTYKYRKDVIVLGYLQEADLAQVLAGSYVMLYPGFFEGVGVPVLEAMKCEVPVITSDNSSLTETGGDAVLYADPANPAAIAEQIKLLFKDENLRRQLIDKGKLQAGKYEWDISADKMWLAIEKAVSG